MELYFFLAIISLTQLCGAQNTTDSIDYSTIDDNPELNEIPVGCNTVNENPPSYQWKKILWPTRSLPSDVVLGGIDSPHLCGKVYVGRAWYNENLLPAKVCGSDGRAFVSYNDTEVMLNESEVLCTQHAIWKPIKETRIPTSAFPVGNTENGEKLFMGRWFVDLRLTPGKVEANSKILQMTYDQRVYRSNQYEILVLKSGNDL
ncbi:uncharacterized protein [Halyomorpha halys]|uniref:uncharacterized protein n=1 Tax=Halyomorpha halys TaxID=286706 RepID=UPI0006D4F606|nr:uncharacterized protein LOC106691167 [Halyomorpha halys]